MIGNLTKIKARFKMLLSVKEFAEEYGYSGVNSVYKLKYRINILSNILFPKLVKFCMFWKFISKA